MSKEPGFFERAAARIADAAKAAADTASHLSVSGVVESGMSVAGRMKEGIVDTAVAASNLKLGDITEGVANAANIARQAGADALQGAANKLKTDEKPPSKES